jgi:hypothetical protein
MTTGSPQAVRLIKAVSLAVSAVLALFTVAAHIILYDTKFDDAWIHFQYSKNLVLGHGLTFNIGDRVLGSGGVVWNALFALPLAVFGIHHVEWVSTGVNLLCLAGATLISWRIACQVAPGWLACLMGAISCCHGVLVMVSIGGMEGALFAFLQLATLQLLLMQRSVLAGACAGLMVGLRMEGVFWVLGMLLMAWRHERARIARIAVSTAFIPLLVLLVHVGYFGVLVANSTLAKKIVFVLPPLHALKQCVRALGTTLSFDMRWTSDGEGWGTLQSCILLAIWGFLVFSGAKRLAQKAPAVAGGALALALTLVFYAVSNPMMFPWYFVTLVPSSSLFACVGLFQVIESHWARKNLAPAASAVVLLILATPYALREWAPFLGLEDGWGQRHPHTDINLRTHQYVRIARWLNTQAHENETVCIAEIGAFAYHFKGRVLDGVGLVSPEALPFHPIPLDKRSNGSLGEIPLGLVQDQKPEFIVTLPILAEELVASSYLENHYDLIACVPWASGDPRWRTLPRTMLSSPDILVFRRKDLPALTPALGRCNGNVQQPL